MEPLDVVPGVVIPAEELRESFARSGGPGGQHANTSATKVVLRFDVEGSTALTEPQRARVRERLGSRLTAEGELVLAASEHRSQTRNREAVRVRLAALLAEGLAPPPPPRRPSRPGRRAQQRRLEGKRARGEIKRLRRRPQG